MFPKKYTIKTTVSSLFGQPITPPSVTYHGRYRTDWFLAKAIARKIESNLTGHYSSARSEVVEITPENNRLIYETSS